MNAYKPGQALFNFLVTHSAADDLVYSFPFSNKIKEPNSVVGRLNFFNSCWPISLCKEANLK